MGHNFSLNANFEDVTVENYDALVIPGGRAPEYLALNEKVLAIIKQFEEKKKLIASIFHGQQILAAADSLKGERCTAYPTVKLNLLLPGAEWLEPEPITTCFRDGSFVTAATWAAQVLLAKRKLRASTMNIQVQGKLGNLEGHSFFRIPRNAQQANMVGADG